MRQEGICWQVDTLTRGDGTVSGGGWRPQVAGGGAQTGSDTFRIPNEVRPHCAVEVGGGWRLAVGNTEWQLGQHAVLPLPEAKAMGGLLGGVIGYLEGMLSVVQAARVVTGSILIIAGLIAIPLPLTPGLPLIIIGLAFGFSWHPKGLRLLRRCRVKWGRLFKRRAMQS